MKIKKYSKNEIIDHYDSDLTLAQKRERKKEIEDLILKKLDLIMYHINEMNMINDAE